MFVIYNPWIFKFMPTKPQGMACFPFILIHSYEERFNNILMNHEKIHIRQQLELLIVPFYVVYMANYLFNLIKYKNHHQAYLNVSFEREAYDNEDNPFYLYERKPLSFFKYFTKKARYNQSI